MSEPRAASALKEEAERHAREAPAPEADQRLRAGIRLRQVATVVTVLVVVVALVAGIVVGVRVVLRSEEVGATRYVVPETNRTTTLFGTHIGYPRDWTLLQLPPRGDRAPLLQLTNFDPRAVGEPGCAPIGTLPDDGVQLLIAQDRGQAGEDAAPRWPVPLRGHGNGCATARWTVRGVAMEATALIGPDVRGADRRQLFDTFHRLRFPRQLSPGVGDDVPETPAAVLASGYVAGRPASWLVSSGAEGPCLQQVVGVEPPGACQPLRLSGPVAVTSTGPWAGVVGVASPEVRFVEAQLAAGDIALGELVPVPRLFGSDLQLFAVELPRVSRGTVVARDGRRHVMGSSLFDPPALPVLAHGGVPGAKWVLIDREQTDGVRCIDYNRGYGDSGSICPTAVPGSRDVEATVFELSHGRRLVVGVISPRVKSVWVMFLNARFVEGRIIEIPDAFLRGGSTLPPRYNVFTVPVQTTESALVVAFDEHDEVIDGLPLGSDVGFGD